jgi:tryptophan-rich sensory protein
MVALVFVLIATILAAHRVDRPAAWLLAPYLGWIMYATSLNIGIALLN